MLTDDEKADKLEDICKVLNMSEDQLRSCEHGTDITKTCRQLIKYLYADPNQRARLLISTMDSEKLSAIHGKDLNIIHQSLIFFFIGYAKLAHPVQTSVALSTLNNAIGNVFATAKRKLEEAELNDDDEE